MWADTILAAEQQHLIRLFAWAALSIIAGTGLATVVAVRRLDSPLLTHFARQTAGWGVVVGIVAAIGWHAARLRDLAGAARLERLVWMNVGLDIGYVAVGCVLAVAGWRLERRLAVAGAGMAIIVQGFGLLLLELQFASLVSR